MFRTGIGLEFYCDKNSYSNFVMQHASVPLREALSPTNWQSGCGTETDHTGEWRRRRAYPYKMESVFHLGFHSVATLGTRQRADPSFRAYKPAIAELTGYEVGVEHHSRQPLMGSLGVDSG